MPLFNAAKNKHQQQFQASGKAINAKVRLYGRIGQALIDAKQSGRDAFAAIEAVMSWDSFAESITGVSGFAAAAFTQNMLPAKSHSTSAVSTRRPIFHT